MRVSVCERTVVSYETAVRGAAGSTGSRWHTRCSPANQESELMLCQSKLVCCAVMLAACGASSGTSSPGSSPDAGISIDGGLPPGNDTSIAVALTPSVNTPVDVAIAADAPGATTFSVPAAPAHGTLTGPGP